MKRNNLEHDRKIIFPKSVLIIVIVLLLIPLFFSVYSITFRERIKIGIVLTTEELYGEGEIARESLNQFDDIFEARILDVKFNESRVRIRNGVYLTDDYFDTQFGNQVRNKYKVEIVMILTNHTINNWLGDRTAIWGQASTKNAMTLVTTTYLQENASLHKKYLKHTTLHEVLHLLGYEHPTDHRKCIMQSASLDTELCEEYKIELHYRAVLWKVGFGHETRAASFLVKVLMSLILSTIFVAAIIIVQFLFKRYIYKENNINQNPLIIGIGLLYINILLITPFTNSFYLRVICSFISIFIYVIIESISYEFQSKRKKQR
ncbi:MAG: hypothetical protein AB1485_08445 [Candidatus Thermoplasmatota archaeon]